MQNERDSESDLSPIRVQFVIAVLCPLDKTHKFTNNNDREVILYIQVGIRLISNH